MPLLAYALTTLANVKAILGITAATYDDILENYIDAATEAIENYCNRRFLSTVHTNEIYDGTGSKYLVLRHYPIITFTSAQKLISDYESNDWEDLETEWLQHQATNGRVFYEGGFHEGFSNYRFTYTAGYVTIPNDVRDACEKLVVEWYNNRTKASGVTSERLGEYAISYSPTVTASQIKGLGLDAILDAYRTPQV
jgi:uncharacterized phiE125 gp8 family phage protein